MSEKVIARNSKQIEERTSSPGQRFLWIEHLRMNYGLYVFIHVRAPFFLSQNCRAPFVYFFLAFLALLGPRCVPLYSVILLIVLFSEHIQDSVTKSFL